MSLKQLTVPSGQGDISRVIIVNWEFDKDFADATLASEDGELLEGGASLGDMGNQSTVESFIQVFVKSLCFEEIFPRSFGRSWVAIPRPSRFPLELCQIALTLLPLQLLITKRNLAQNCLFKILSLSAKH